MGKSKPVQFDHGVAILTAAGETEPGDSFLFCPTQAGFIAVVVDGLGHGAEAAKAARLVVETVKTHPCEEPCVLMQLCHEKLLETRGAAVAIAEYVQETKTLRAVIVGNVQMVLVHRNEEANPREHVIQRSGTVGLHLPVLSGTESTMSASDTLVMVTDGVKTNFDNELALHLAPQHLAEDIVSNHGIERVDALALVVRRGGSV